LSKITVEIVADCDVINLLVLSQTAAYVFAQYLFIYLLVGWFSP